MVDIRARAFSAGHRGVANQSLMSSKRLGELIEQTTDGAKEFARSKQLGKTVTGIGG